jgi:DNA-binding transcriptional LysR family regulator
MKLTLDALTVLDAIDRRGSFAAASEELHRVPSAISYTVQKLEQDLDATVFNRSGHRAVLTPAGKALLDEGRHLLSAAHELECHVKRVATGWEAELRIAVDTIYPVASLLPLIQRFYDENQGTQLQLRHEVLGGTWDALVSNRADLIIGASGDGPPGGGYSSQVLGEVDMVFVVARDHPLAHAEEPLSSSELLRHRAIVIADSSRQLPPRSIGLLSGQKVLSVPDMETKLVAQCQGLGVGYLPRNWVKSAVANGQLVIKEVEDAPRGGITYVAWRSDHQGKALKWFVQRLNEAEIQARLFAGR